MSKITMDLPAALADKLDQLSERGNVLLDERGDWHGAIEQWLEALTLLPEPKAQWEAWTLAECLTRRRLPNRPCPGGCQSGALRRAERTRRALFRPVRWRAGLPR